MCGPPPSSNEGLNSFEVSTSSLQILKCQGGSVGKISNTRTARWKTNGVDPEFGVGRGGLGLPRSLTTHHFLGRGSSQQAFEYGLSLGKSFCSNGTLASLLLASLSSKRAKQFQMVFSDSIVLQYRWKPACILLNLFNKLLINNIY